MDRFARGDLTVRATLDEEDYGNAIQRLFEGGNQAVESVQRTFSDVKVAEETASAASQISASSDQMAASVEEQSAQAEEVRELAEEADAATGEIADMIGQVQSEAEEAVERVRVGTDRVQTHLQY
jgi:methyl-accepting chemotaxis protein